MGIDIKSTNHYGRLILILKGHIDKVNTLDFTSCGNYLVSGGYNRVLILFGVNPKHEKQYGKILLKIEPHISAIYSICCNPLRKSFAIGAHDKTIKIYE